MKNDKTRKVFDLEVRTFNFAKDIRDFVYKGNQKDFVSVIYFKQLIRSSSSIGANYIEAVESLGTKDYLMRLKICRKEAKETIYWLKLITPLSSFQQELDQLINEANEIMRIFGALVTKLKKQLDQPAPKI